MDLAAHVTAVLSLDPDAPAVEFEERWTSWGELSRIARELDRLLTAAGCAEGAGVACLSRTRPEHIGVLVATLTTRRAVVTVNPFQGADKVAADLRTLMPAVVVADAATWSTPELRAVVDELGAVGIVVRAAPAGAALVTARATPTPGPRGTVPPDTAVQMLTSGTTGPPKRIPLTFTSLEHSLLGVRHYESAKPAVRLATGVLIVNAPLVHISGIWNVLTCLTAGRRMALLERFRVEPWLALVERHRPKVASLVPAALRMVHAADVDPARLASLQVVTCGTAPIEPEEAAAFEDRYGIPVLVLYGATEFAGGVAGWTLDDHRRWARTKRGSVGRAHPGCELRIVDPESGTVLAHGTVGLLEVMAPQLGRDDWVRTTDLAVLDDDGFLWIKGRVDDAIIRGGFKVIPVDVERVLETHPAVREAAVVGLPDARLGAVPAAAVELEPGHTVSAAELREHARLNLTGYQVPVAFRVVGALPRTPSLKVSRPAVRDLFDA
jgi:acyl-CoA synthetase (AMP-forming)/AMP-acid ligase II